MFGNRSKWIPKSRFWGSETRFWNLDPSGGAFYEVVFGSWNGKACLAGDGTNGARPDHLPLIRATSYHGIGGSVILEPPDLARERLLEIETGGNQRNVNFRNSSKPRACPSFSKGNCTQIQLTSYTKARWPTDPDPGAPSY